MWADFIKKAYSLLYNIGWNLRSIFRESTHSQKPNVATLKPSLYGTWPFVCVKKFKLEPIRTPIEKRLQMTLVLQSRD